MAVVIAGDRSVPPDPASVPAMIDDLFHRRQQMPPIRAVVHAQLMKIHPFVNGNGRTGRLLPNLWLMQRRYVPMLLEPEGRAAYPEALQAADEGQFHLSASVVAHRISRTLSCYEQVLHLSPEPPASRQP